MLTLAHKDLRHIDIAVFVEADADAHLGPGAGQNVLPVTGGGHERRLRFLNGGVMGDVLASAVKRVAEGGQHVLDAAISGRLMGKLVVVAHIAGFDPGDA